MKGLLGVAVLAIPWLAVAADTRVTIVGEDFHINGRPTYEGRVWRGHRVEGLLMNSRMVQAVFRRSQSGNRPALGLSRQRRLGRGAEHPGIHRRNARMAGERPPGGDSQSPGGSPEGYSKSQPWINGAFESDGSLRPAYLDRLRRVLDAADGLGMVVILGYFYFGQDERLEDEAAVIRAVDGATRWILEGGWENVLVEINNECNVKYDHAILRPERVHELIEGSGHGA